MPKAELSYDPRFLAALRYHLYRKKWRAVDLHRAAKKGVAKSAISAWLNKKGRPTLVAVDRVCEAFEVSVSDFWKMGEEIVEEEARRRRAEERAKEQREIESAEDVEVLLRKIRSLPPDSLARLKAEILLVTPDRGEGDGTEDPRDLAVEVVGG